MSDEQARPKVLTLTNAIRRGELTIEQQDRLIDLLFALDDGRPAQAAYAALLALMKEDQR